MGGTCTKVHSTMTGYHAYLRLHCKDMPSFSTVSALVNMLASRLCQRFPFEISKAAAQARAGAMPCTVPG